jgi:hypothetical protein
MNTLTYTVSLSDGLLQHNSGTGTTFYQTQALTGTTDVTFALSGLSAYDASTSQKINKIVVDYDEGIRGRDGLSAPNLIINRPLSTTIIPTLSTETFNQVLQTEFTDEIERNVYFSLYRDDLEVDIIEAKFTITKPSIDIYENINLIKTDYFNNEEDNEKILLTFINKNPEVLGLSLINLNLPGGEGHDPALPVPRYTGTNLFNIGFTTEYVQVDAKDSNTGDSIQISLDDIYTATGEIKNNSKVTLRYRTRAADPNEAILKEINYPNTVEAGSLLYVPLTANTGFVHLSGFVNWNCNDLIKDVSLQKQTINIPLVDIKGTRTNLADYTIQYYFQAGGTVGIGASQSTPLSSGYFYVDLFDVNACDSITTRTNTITAFVNY